MGKRSIMTMAVVAVMVLSALLVPVFNADAREGDSKDNAKYIYGSNSASELLTEKDVARISYNNTAFVSPSVTISIGKYADDESSYTTVYGGTSSSNFTGTGYTVSVAEVASGTGVDSGRFDVTFQKTTGAVDGEKIIIKLAVTQAVDTVSKTQSFYYGANVKVQNAVESVEVDTSDIQGATYSDSTLTFNYDESVLVGILAKDSDGTGLDGCKFYGTGLPEGMSVTTEGKIGGKLSTASSATSGTMTIYAVKDGEVVSAEVRWAVGDKSTYDFQLKVDDAEASDVVVVAGEEFTLSAAKTGSSNVTKYTLNKYDTSDGLTVTGDLSQTTEPASWTIKAEGTGTYVLSVTAEMAYGSETFTMEKEFTVYVIGGVYDGNLKPVVKDPDA